MERRRRRSTDYHGYFRRLAPFSSWLQPVGRSVIGKEEEGSGTTIYHVDECTTFATDLHRKDHL